MMDRYYCPHGSPTQAEANRCQQCRERAKIIIAGPQRACADCFAYSPAKQMITKTDGRVICAPCQKRVQQLTADRAQAALFDDQLTMF